MLDKKLLQELFDDLGSPHKSCFKTGFTDLDTIIKIPENKGALITIGARPAMGKTTFMLSIMEKMLDANKKVIYFSIEMPTEQLLKKILFQKAEVSHIKPLLNNLDSNDFEKLSNAKNSIEEWDLTIDDSSTKTKQIELAINKQKPDVVFIDYFQLISDNDIKDRNIQIENNIKELKRIAKEYGVVIFLASQMSRAVESRCDKRPLLSDLRKPEDLGHFSDIVILLYRDEYYNVKEINDIKPQGKTEITIAKNELGVCGSIYATFDPNIPKFYADRAKK